MSSELLDFSHDERLDQSEALSFRLPRTSRKANLLSVDNELRWRGRIFKVFELEDEREGEQVFVRVEAPALWHKLGDAVFVGSFVISALTPADGLAQILAGTSWVADETSTPSATTYSMEGQDRSRLDLLRSWAKITGKFLTFDTAGQSVKLADSRGRDLGLGFRYGRNVKTIRRRLLPPEVTVLYPFGAQGLTIAGINGGAAFLEDFSYYTDQGITIDDARAHHTRSRVWSDSSFLRDTELLEAATARLARLAQPTVSYELSVLDLSELLSIEERPLVGDTVRVSDPDLGEDVRTTVVRTLRYPLEPDRNRIELAYLPNPLGDANDASRPATSENWTMFRAEPFNDFDLRYDFEHTVARLPLRFREGGQAHYHVDYFGTAIGDGTLTAKVIDALTGLTVYQELAIPYLSGEIVHGSFTWAAIDLEGAYDYRLRLDAATTGGPSTTEGADLLSEGISFYILAIGAVQETPSPGTTEQRFDFTGAVQAFDVPDFVTEVEVEVVGACGAGFDTASGRGGMVVGKFAVTPLETIVVEVGENPAAIPGGYLGGWPNGGDGGYSTYGASNGYAGGGSSAVHRGSFASALVVGGAGGGLAENGKNGGDAGFWTASSGEGPREGGGATQVAGGAGGVTGGGDGAANAGGDGGIMSSVSSFYAGGGGGGWYGGGGGALPDGLGSANGGGGGGGGTGYVDPTLVYDWTATDLANEVGDGWVIFRWAPPE